jgi:IMP cyclohydrolase
MDLPAAADANMDSLRQNRYPGRGIVIGQTPDRRHLVQVYWIMGRSENSRNRIFVQEGDLVRTAPFDESKVKDPSLIIYNCVRTWAPSAYTPPDDVEEEQPPPARSHIVTNGDQTDTVYEGLELGRTFEESLYTRTFEPDAPNYTPRIAGLVELANPRHAYQLGILKTLANNEDYPARQVFNYGTFIGGIGHFIATYDGDGSPLPSFTGEPRPLPLRNGIGETLDLYWEALDQDNKVSLLVKFIDPETDECEIRIVNKNQ